LSVTEGRGRAKLSGATIAAKVQARPGSVPQAAERTNFLIESLGSGAELARLLGVNRSQPAQWRSGKETPGPVTAQRLVDLDYVVAKALLIWPPKAAIDWLEGSNLYLDGARPIDVLRLRGSADVVRALEVAMA
jgi:transcriptional regulator with XRE-family HTH domain